MVFITLHEHKKLKADSCSSSLRAALEKVQCACDTGTGENEQGAKGEGIGSLK